MKMNKISRISFLWSKIKSNVTSFSFVLSLLLGGLCFSSQAADAKWYPGRLLVKPKQGVSAVALQSFNKTMGITASRVLEAANNDWQVIDARVKPYAGYLVIADENLSIDYRPYDAN